MGDDSVQIIYLNGPSSSGKSTLAKALQQAFEKPFLHISADKIIGWMPEKINAWFGGEAPLGFSWKKSQDKRGHPIQELQLGTFAKKIPETFREIVIFLAEKGYHIIVDDFPLTPLDDWKEALKNFSVLWVAVNAPLPILEQREKERGNRMVGSARGQFYKMGPVVSYDLHIDTYNETLSQNVEKVVDACQGIRQASVHRQVTRIGVYGLAKKGSKILFVTQIKGPYAGKLDLPGGGIEFGETVSETLHREFIEEVNMDFGSMEPIANLTACLQVPWIKDTPPYTFHHIGLIYAVEGLRDMESAPTALVMNYQWVEKESLTKESVTPLVWMTLLD